MQLKEARSHILCDKSEKLGSEGANEDKQKGLILLLEFLLMLLLRITLFLLSSSSELILSRESPCLASLFQHSIISQDRNRIIWHLPQLSTWISKEKNLSSVWEFSNGKEDWICKYCQTGKILVFPYVISLSLSFIFSPKYPIIIRKENKQPQDMPTSALTMLSIGLGTFLTISVSTLICLWRVIIF